MLTKAKIEIVGAVGGILSIMGMIGTMVAVFILTDPEGARFLWKIILTSAFCMTGFGFYLLQSSVRKICSRCGNLFQAGEEKTEIIGRTPGQIMVFHKQCP